MTFLQIVELVIIILDTSPRWPMRRYATFVNQGVMPTLIPIGHMSPLVNTTLWAKIIYFKSQTLVSLFCWINHPYNRLFNPSSNRLDKTGYKRTL